MQARNMGTKARERKSNLKAALLQFLKRETKARTHTTFAIFVQIWEKYGGGTLYLHIAKQICITFSLSSRRALVKRDSAALHKGTGANATALRAVPTPMQLPMLSDILKASVCGHKKIRIKRLQFCQKQAFANKAGRAWFQPCLHTNPIQNRRAAPLHLLI